MNKYKGIYKLFFKQDIKVIFIALFFTLGFVIGPDQLSIGFGIKDNSAVENYIFFISALSIMLVADYAMSFSYRYIIFNNYCSYRKNFYNYMLMVTWIKSAIVALIEAIVLIYELYFSRLRNVSTTTLMFNKTSTNISMNDILKVFILLLFINTVIYSVSFAMASIEKFTLPVSIILMITGMVFFRKIFLLNVSSSTSYIVALCTLFFINLASAAISKIVINRKPSHGSQWLTKLYKAVGVNK
jgi:hypothetical protein